MTKHGGARPGAGRPGINVNVRRVMALVAEGFTQREIGERFGVGYWVIRRIVRQERNK